MTLAGWLLACASLQPPMEPILTVPPGTFAPSSPAEAWAARPRAPHPARAGVWALDEPFAELFAAQLEELEELEQVVDLWEHLPEELDPQPAPWPHQRHLLAPLGLERLRQAASEADVDLLVVADYSTLHQTRINGWLPVCALYLPLLFAPCFNVEDHSTLHVHVLDVRTGYLYGEAGAMRHLRRAPVTAYAETRHALVRAQRDELVAEIRDEVREMLGGSPRSAPRQATAVRSP